MSAEWISDSLAAFYLFSVLLGGFSYILAFGLMQMQGLGGLHGWRWIFVSICFCWLKAAESVTDGEGERL
jgi:hypothetical protein